MDIDLGVAVASVVAARYLIAVALMVSVGHVSTALSKPTDPTLDLTMSDFIEVRQVEVNRSAVFTYDLNLTCTQWGPDLEEVPLRIWNHVLALSEAEPVDVDLVASPKEHIAWIELEDCQERREFHFTTEVEVGVDADHVQGLQEMQFVAFSREVSYYLNVSKRFSVVSPFQGDVRASADTIALADYRGASHLRVDVSNRANAPVLVVITQHANSTPGVKLPEHRLSVEASGLLFAEKVRAEVPFSVDLASGLAGEEPRLAIEILAHPVGHPEVTFGPFYHEIVVVIEREEGSPAPGAMLLIVGLALRVACMRRGSEQRRHAAGSEH